MHEIVNTYMDKLIEHINNSKICVIIKQNILEEINKTRFEIQNAYSNKIYELYEDTFDDIRPKSINYDYINKDDQETENE